MKAKIVLENGTIMVGKSFGAEKDYEGEFVFNTSMTGYQEILTDPSYNQQIVVMTYPLIGNYGINEEDFESEKVQVAGFIVKEYSKIYSNRRASSSLGDFLKKHNIPGVEGVDTRKLTRLIRIQGAMNGLIHFGNETDEKLLERVRAIPSMAGLNLAQKVSTQDVSCFALTDPTEKHFRIIALDYGIKTNIMRLLTERGCEIIKCPCNITMENLMELKPDGIFLSNGPGDPAAVIQAIELCKELIGKLPIFGICLGHQILGLALGFKTYKLKFGHRGGNQPVMNLLNKKVEITAQNHGFCLKNEDIPQDVKITHLNLNDQTVEGIEHKQYPVFSVQYHPEASPGPHDSQYLFDKFIENLKEEKQKKQGIPT